MAFSSFSAIFEKQIGFILLSVQNLSIFHKKGGVYQCLLQPVNLLIPNGEVLALTGPSGVGKTMLALGITGLYRYMPSISISGEVQLDGENILTLSDLSFREKIASNTAIIWQHPMAAFNPYLRLGSQLPFLASHDAVNRLGVMEEFRRYLCYANVDDEKVMHSFPHQLSTGQLQRVLVALAVARKPKIIVTDEATASLDSDTAQSIMEMLQTYHTQSRCIWILITHNADQIARFANAAIYLDRGGVSEGLGASIAPLPLNEIARGPSLALKTKSAEYPSVSLNQIPILEINHLSFSYSSSPSYQKKNGADEGILADVSVSFMPGKFYGLLGKSGEGKSSLAKLLVGELTPLCGEIRWNSLSSKNKVQLVQQDALLSLDPGMPVDAQLKEIIACHFPKKGNVEKMQELRKTVEKAGLRWDELSKLPEAFSGGQLQRIVLIRTMLVEPEFVIFDESFSALDWKSLAEISELINHFYDQHPFTSLWISHDFHLLQAHCQEILELSNGSLNSKTSSV